eukprot:TRINITY_DN4303_c0_g1_i2.p1 TRINITY_DN4303_c0_g1~~TRINITY_DN4303_c0_g1_i2.p1  ORF type:complete len:617 (+),score=228.65 TRINITY_DN4303_c0_g1_i2:78-1928(+)
MEPLPPRNSSRSSGAHAPKKESPSSLETLLALGFPRSRAEKSLVVTGDRGVQVASDWLLSHVSDPRLDDPTPRKFLLYLVPLGELGSRLQTFWDSTRTQIGRNGIHDSFPHVTLFQPFPVPFNKVLGLRSSLEKARVLSQPPDEKEPWKFEKYTSHNFMGLFFGKQEEVLLRTWVNELQGFLQEKLDIHVCPIPNGFHVSLAYQFLPKAYSALEDLLSAVDLESVPVDASSWELRLYSYDPKALNGETGVYKVNYPLVPREEDELPLLSGDYVYISHSEFASSSDGWVSGTSWLSGLSGFLPKNYVSKTQDSNAWTLHSSIKLLKSLKEIGSEGSSQAREEDVPPIPAPREVYIVRHGERVDFTFGSWIPFCFDASGRYTRKDLNMPKSLPARSKGPEGFSRDCPLTCLGETQARLTGEAMSDGGVSITHVYSSPSLRCIQTTHQVLGGLGLAHLKINIEPGLFEWLAWYQDGSMPDWMSQEELLQAGFNVSTSYKPYISQDELQDTQESAENFYIRNCFVTQCILQATEEAGGNVLLVAHAPTLDAASRQLVGGEPRSVTEMMSIVKKVSYCGVARLVQDESQDASSKWRLEKPNFPAMTHSSSNRFDWSILLDK